MPDLSSFHSIIKNQILATFNPFIIVLVLDSEPLLRYFLETLACFFLCKLGIYVLLRITDLSSLSLALLQQELFSISYIFDLDILALFGRSITSLCFFRALLLLDLPLKLSLHLLLVGDLPLFVLLCLQGLLFLSFPFSFGISLIEFLMMHVSFTASFLFLFVLLFFPDVHLSLYAFVFSLHY